jgi:hypothetical protein
MEEMASALYARPADLDLPESLIAILADERVERRRHPLVTAHASVACPGAGGLWSTFGGYPAASRGNWQRVAWPW